MTKRRGGRTGVALVVSALIAAAAAHAYLEGATPEAGVVHVGAIDIITLRFDSPVERRFSRFEVVRLALPDDAWPADPRAPSARELQRIEGLAAQAAGDLRGGRETGLATVRVAAATTGSGTTVALDLGEALEPGAYLVLWEVLAADGHATAGHHVILVGAACCSGADARSSDTWV